MKPTMKVIHKIRWQIWDGDKLVIQAITKRTVEKDTRLLESTSLGSVKYTFTGIDTKEKVDKIVEDIENGTLK